ncbi:MAG: VTT domain-containing protein [Nanoarchaeota archaeon]
MDVQAIITSLIYDIPVITTFLATLIFGEEVVIILGFISGLGLLPLWILFVFGFIGTLLSDLLWFVVGKTLFRERKNHWAIHTHYHKFMRHVDRMAANNMFFALFITRFFYFFRLFAIVHLSRLGMPYRRFLLYEIPIIGVWLVIFVAIGWFFGSAAVQYLDVFGGLQKIIASIVIILVMSLLIKSLIRKVWEKNN